ncbi:hypothetical protein EW146_g5462 [Bondarzewia mesenterica]|uniref:Peptide hydrolase n=1 Tax=Bondarzewia mesenterica TaxID=1095465 RepID=A0A4S4LSG5_9AGAM|nr:hypothetical protein EW146_g5462 [Bondarzewia mesenterica]
MAPTPSTRPHYCTAMSLGFWATTLLFLLSLIQCTYEAPSFGERDLPALSSAALSSLTNTNDPVKNLDSSNVDSHLYKILIPRSPDTANHTLVREHIVSTLRALDWHIEEDSFMDNTPFGLKNFTNVIATKDPDAPRRVVLAAHFDSKFFSTYPKNQFVGATDSAAPCALMLDLAETLDPLLNARARRIVDSSDDWDFDEDESLHTTLQLVFFDGEEAFKDWTDTDSIYGARHLAEKWSTTYLPPHPKRRLLSPTSPSTPLSTIEHLVLLDLLGAASPMVRSYYPDTAWLFDSLVRAESRLRDAGLLEAEGEANAAKERSFFRPRTGQEASYGYIGDDHIPFLHRGVSVLHIITEPFPSVWHTLRDDASALDLPTLRRWNLIFRVFFCEYLGLQPDEKTKRAQLPSPSISPASETVSNVRPEVRRSDSELRFLEHPQ